MPISIRKDELEDEFISRCMSEEKESFPNHKQRYAVCKSYWDRRDEMSGEVEDVESGLGGDLPSVDNFSQTSFECTPTSNEKLNEFLSRCMSDSDMRKFKKDRRDRIAYCYSKYYDNYKMSLARKWK